MLLSLAFTVTYPFVTRSLFDDAIPGGEMSAVLQLLGVLAAAFAITLAAGLRQTVQTSRISGSVVRDLRQEMFGRLQRVPDAWSNRHPQGDVLSRMMNDVSQVQSGLSTAINDGVFQGVSLVVATIIMLRVNLPLGGLVLVGAPARRTRLQAHVRRGPYPEPRGAGGGERPRDGGRREPPGRPHRAHVPAGRSRGAPLRSDLGPALPGSATAHAVRRPVRDHGGDHRDDPPPRHPRDRDLADLQRALHPGRAGRVPRRHGRGALARSPA